MPIIAWLKSLGSSDERLRAMERQLEQLRRKLEEGTAPPIRIEYANVEKIIIEKWEHSNNFGALGIKELAGTLNIGANYKGPLPEEWIKSMMGMGEENDEPKGDCAAGKGTGEKGRPGRERQTGPPAYTIRARGRQS